MRNMSARVLGNQCSEKTHQCNQNVMADIGLAKNVATYEYRRGWFRAAK